MEIVYGAWIGSNEADWVINALRLYISRDNKSMDKGIVYLFYNSVSDKLRPTYRKAWSSRLAYKSL
jgi:hypothetical protein